QTTLEIRGYAPILQEAELENLIGRDTRRLEYPKTTIAKLKQLVIADKALATGNLANEVHSYLKSRAAFWRPWFAAIKVRVQRLFNTSREQTRTPVPPFKHTEQELRAYLGLIDTSPVNQTTLVEISVTTGRPKLSQQIANTHAEVFIEHLRQERQQELQENLQALEQHAAELRQKLVVTEEALAKYAREQQLVALPNSRDESLTAKNISDLKALLAEATARRIKSETMLNEVKSANNRESTLLDDEGIRDLKSRLDETQAQYSVLLEKTTPLYPPLIELKTRIASLQRSIREGRDQRRKALEAQHSSDVAAEAKLAEQVEKERAAANEMSGRLVQYNLLLREAESLRTLTDAVAKELKQTQISAASSKSNIYVSDYAALPRRPSAPKVKFILTVSLVLGLGLGLALALFAEMLNNKITCSEDAQQCLGLSALGSLPSFTYKEAANSGKSRWSIPALPKLGLALPSRREQTQDNQSAAQNEANRALSTSTMHRAKPIRPLVTVTAPQAAVSEALRTIRAGILFSSADHPARVILVTSAGKGDGKTTVAANLAVSLAQAAYRTLLIDGDLRAPNASWYFGIPPCSPGLVNFLTGHTEIDDIVLATGVPSLSIIPAGAATPNPAELAGSVKFAEMLKTLASRFDFVILDSPPIIPVADGLMLSRAVDGVLFVVRTERTERPRAQEAVRRLRRVGAHLLGVVVNDVARNGNIYSVDRDLYSYEKMFNTDNNALNKDNRKACG
ncbi:MAG TPA: polysaccharide biosynthesis tyrosine autokinase, partial [Oligoflexia bacterium]|nr:polysaccharide biosynthesis tyrosine autokinase [Oligoflexia bacterium]